MLAALLPAEIFGVLLVFVRVGAAMMLLLVLGEVAIGVFIGTVARFFIAALTTTGMMIAYMSALANALINDPSAAQQGSIAGSFLTIVALLVIFALDLHHLMLRALVESYQLFVPGRALPFGDFADMIARVMSKTFLLAFQLATPFIAAATIFYLGVGLLARLMPQVHVFFVAMPLRITLGLVMMSLALPFVIRWFAGSFEETLLPFAGGAVPL